VQKASLVDWPHKEGKRAGRIMARLSED